jgi:hypothetical protein
MKAIVTNSAYGYGPLFRMVDLAKLLRSAFDKRAYNDWYIIVPLVYPSFQIRALKAKYGSDERILLDPRLGRIFRDIFFEGGSYNSYLRRYAQTFHVAQDRIHYLFQEEMRLKNLRGERVVVDPSSIKIEVAHNPRVSLPAPRKYYTSIALFSDILLRSRRAQVVNVGKAVFSRCLEIAIDLEQQYETRFISEPSTFSYVEFPSQRAGVSFAPPLIHIEDGSSPAQLPDEIIYFYLSGISKRSFLPRLNIKDSRFHLYCSRTGYSKKGIRYADPSIIFNPKVKAVVSRAGWSTIWSCLVTSKPFLALPFRRTDDPEMFFNLRTLVALKLGQVLRSGLSEATLYRSYSLIRKQEEIVDRLLSLYGTVDGLQYVAQKISKHFQSSKELRNER